MKLTDWIALFSLVISLVILWQFRQILLLVFMAMVIAIAINSLVRWLMRRMNWPRGRAVLASFVLVLLGGSVILALVLPPFVTQFQQLIQTIPSGTERLVVRANRFLNNPPDWFPNPDLQLLPSFADIVQQIGSVGSLAFGNFVAFFSNSVAILLQILMVLIFSLMLVANPTAYRGLMIRLFPSSYRRRADYIFSKCEVALLSWMGGVSANSVFVAALSFVGLLILGVDYPFANAVLAGVFNLVPNIGPILSSIFPVIVALIESPGKALAVVVLYLIIQNLESYWFSPMMMEKQISLLPAATLVAQLFFATFLGPLGLILALPLAVVCKTWIEEAWIKDVLEAVPVAAGQQSSLMMSEQGAGTGQALETDPDDGPSLLPPSEELS